MLVYSSGYRMTYENLVNARKSCRLCVDRDQGKIWNAAKYCFDPPVVSHWSQWLGHQKPKLLIVGQDFSNREYFEIHKGCDAPENSTNENLRILLGIAGLKVGQPPERDSGSPVYLTNAILCMKEGSMKAPIKTRWINACAQTHLVPLIAHLRPRIVIGMGVRGWQAVRTAFGLRAVPLRISEAAGSRFQSATGEHVFAVGHCGPLGIANRPLSLQQDDWRKIGQKLLELS